MLLSCRLVGGIVSIQCRKFYEYALVILSIGRFVLFLADLIFFCSCFATFVLHFLFLKQGAFVKK